MKATELWDGKDGGPAPQGRGPGQLWAEELLHESTVPAFAQKIYFL